MAASPPLLHFPPSLPLIPFNIPIAQDRHHEALEVLEIEMGREYGLSNEPPQPPSESQGRLQAGGGRDGTCTRQGREAGVGQGQQVGLIGSWWCPQ